MDLKGKENSFWQDLFVKGDDLQKISVIQSLPDLLQTDNNATVSRIIPKIQQELPNSSSEFHIVTSQIFKLLIQMKVSINLIRPVLQGIDSRDPIVAGAWVESLLAVIHCLPESIVKTEVLPFTIKMSQINRTLLYRTSSCKLLGQIAIHDKMSAFDVKKDILPYVQSLCQDCLYEVRASMCGELPRVAQGLATDSIIKASLLPCLVELSSDENMNVRAAAVDAVVYLIPFLGNDTIRATVIPLMKRLCVQSCKEHDYTYPTVAKSYGLLLNNLQLYLLPTDSIWFLDFYKQLSKKGLSSGKDELDIEPALSLQCRECCAYNLPAVTYFTVTRIPGELQKWNSIFRDLACDPCYVVRRTVAGCIHEIARILEKDCKILVADVVRLLRDDAEEVLDALVPNIAKTLEMFSVLGILPRENATQFTLEIGRALLKCQLEVFRFYNWRRKLSFLQQLERLPYCMPADFIHQHFTSAVMKLTIEGRSRPVRTQATRTILFFLRYCSKENHRKWIRENLINLLCNSPSCYTRHIYINMCVNAIEIFSWKYFKEYFYTSLLSLGDDPVSTVRLCVVNLCPVLKQMLVLPIDRVLQGKLESFVSKIEMMEKDKDVLWALKCKLKEMRSSSINKQETLLEERKKIEEEERIVTGKLAQSVAQSVVPARNRDVIQPRIIARRTPSKTSDMASKKSTTSSYGLSSDMSFLDKHFYTDAGVALPESAEVDKLLSNRTSGLEESVDLLKISTPRAKIPIEDESVSTISVVNTNFENMSDEDLKELETSTTNITDDVKVNLQKINKNKSIKMASDVNKRNKRYSCTLPSEQSQILKNMMKRRSLNISNEGSKIPVSFRARKTVDDKLSAKGKSSSDRSNTCKLHYSLKTEIENRQRSTIETNCNTRGTAKGIDENEVKENVPANFGSKIITPNNSNKKSNSTKISNLPVLTRRTNSRYNNN